MPAPVFFVAGAIAQYVGAALAVGLFDALPPPRSPGCGSPSPPRSSLRLWLRRVRRQVRAARTPQRSTWSSWDPELRRAIVVFGAALAGMNLCFYLAIDRLPLGTAVAIEFSGPIAVAAFAARRRRNLVAVGLAAAGVLLLADVQWQASAAGVVAASAPPPCGPSTSSAGGRVGGRRSSGLEGLPGRSSSARWRSCRSASAGLAAGDRVFPWSRAASVVALLSSVVPYSLDQLVLPRLAAGQFALLLSLLPVHGDHARRAAARPAPQRRRSSPASAW